MSEAIERILDLGFLGAIAPDDLLSLRPAPTLLSLKAGETILWQGETGQAYFLLLRGRLRRFVDDAGKGRRFVGDVVPGQGVGSSGILSAGGNASTVRVMHDSEVVRFPRAVFLQMMVLSWEFAIGISREQIERVRSAVAPGGKHPTIKRVAVVPLDPTVDQGAFIERLAAAITAIVPATAVDRSSIDTHGGMDAAVPAPSSLPADTDAVFDWLEAFERRHDIVLYPVSREVDAWSRVILARADLVLLVTSVDGMPGLCGIETELIAPRDDELLPRIDLVVLHGRDFKPDCGTRKWLDARHVDEWHHLRSGNDKDFQRLARILTGNAVSLVLGGGGARGLAEIGVARALAEAGVPVDRLAGTSMGSLIAGLLASGKTIDAVADAVRKWTRDGRPGRDYTLPALSLVHGKKLHHATHDVLGDSAIEDLPLPFFCISADLSENRTVVHDRGSLWRSVRASMSVPGLGPPLFDRGRILVDGGIVNNLPADVTASRHAGRIIIVDVSIPRKFAAPDEYDDLVPSGWQILWHRISPFRKSLQVPGIFEVLTRLTTLSSRATYLKAREVADLEFQPPVSDTGLLGFHEIDRLVQVGEEHAVERLRSVGSAKLRAMFRGAADIRLEEAIGSAPLPPIDRTRFDDILGVHDDEAFEEILGAFVGMFPAELDALEKAVTGRDRDRIRERAHRAKSGAVNLAATGLAARLLAIETRARNGEVDGMSEQVDAVRSEFERLLAYHRGLKGPGVAVERTSASPAADAR